MRSKCLNQINYTWLEYYQELRSSSDVLRDASELAKEVLGSAKNKTRKLQISIDAIEQRLRSQRLAST